MQSSLRIGRFGPLILNLHYTWLLLSVLGLWWLALLWLPGQLPDRQAYVYWLSAILVLLLFLASVIAHELIHSLVAGTGPRSLIVYPFGSATPYRSRLLLESPARAVASALSGPLFNILLGGALLTLAGGLDTSAGGLSEGAAAIITPLAWLNLWLGIANLLPGIPFDGGWLLNAVLVWFTGEQEGGMGLARSLGTILTLGLALLGAWRGLVTESWLQALSLMLLAWSAREAAENSKQRTLVHNAMVELQAHDFMDRTRPGDEVLLTDTVAQMVKAHPRYAPDLPLPVVDEEHALAGVVTLSAADDLLQGSWASTPVLSVMHQPSEVAALDPNTPLSEVVTLVEKQTVPPTEQPSIPVLSDGQLVGSVDPSKIAAFEQIDLELGADDAPVTVATQSEGRGQVRKALVAVLVIAGMAIFGTMALRSNPYDARNFSANPPAGVSFSGFSPAEGSTAASGFTELSVNMVAAEPVMTGFLTLDGKVLDMKLAEHSPYNKTLSIQVAELAQGSHTAQVVAATLGGKLSRAEWQFQVGETSAATATPQPAKKMLSAVEYSPVLGSRVRSSADGLALAVGINSDVPPTEAHLYLDGEEIASKVVVSDTGNRLYSVQGTAPALTPGEHRVRATVDAGDASTLVSEWTFQALEPDANNAYFEETGHFVSQPFLAFWQENGGLTQFGYPISDLMQETDATTGEKYTSQYFERSRFELHPATGNKVILGRLGALLQPLDPPVAAAEGAQYFPETGHNLSGPFLDYWNTHGGLALFGYPLTEARVEKNELDGKEYLVQYFERSRFELHPELADTGFAVQLGQLGTRLLHRLQAPQLGP